MALDLRCSVHGICCGFRLFLPYASDMYGFIKKGMKEGIESGKSYLLRIRKGPHSEYVTAWIYNRTNSCIAVIPYVETEWDLSGLMV